MKILVIAAHPDDEVLGCGGTLYKLSKKKEHQLFLAFAADGVSGRGKNIKDIEQRQQESLKVAHFLKAEILNIKDEPYYRFKDQMLDQKDFNEVVDWIKFLIASARPEVIYTHYAGDINRDHRIITEAVFVATRPNKYNFIKKIHSFEINMGAINQGHTLGNGLFSPNVFEKIDVSKKIKLFSIYQSEHQYWKNWRHNLETIARFRGLGAAYDFAEAFLLVRERND